MVLDPLLPNTAFDRFAPQGAWEVVSVKSPRRRGGNRPAHLSGRSSYVALPRGELVCPAGPDRREMVPRSLH